MASALSTRPAADTVADSSLSDRMQFAARRGVSLALPAQVGKLLVYIASLGVLSRLLPPEDFGVLGMVVAFTGFLDLFKDLGLGMAIVQARELTPGMIGALQWIVGSVTALLAGVVWMAGPLLVWFYRQPLIAGLVPFLAVAVLANGMSVVPQALTRRAMQFGRLAVIDVLAPLAGAAAAVVAAWQGYGVRALALQPCVQGLATLVLSWLLTPSYPGRVTWGPDVLRALGFGGHLSGFIFVNYWARNLDNVLIGRFWGATQLGFYARAYALLTAPISLINGPLSSVYIPALSRLQHCDTSFARHYLRGLSLGVSFSLPLSAVLAVSADEVIRVVLGPGWDEVVVVFRLLALSSASQVIGNTTGWVYTALGRTDRQFRWGIFASTVLVASFFVGLPWGSRGVALAYSSTSLTLLLPNLWYTTRGTAISMAAIGRCCRLPALAALLAAGALAIVRSQLAGLGLGWTHDFLVLASAGVLVMASFGFCQWRRIRIEAAFEQAMNHPSAALEAVGPGTSVLPAAADAPESALSAAASSPATTPEEKILPGLVSL